MKANFFIITVFFTLVKGFSQQQLSLQECETLFLKNNLYLLANHYNIDATEAQVLQAKIWDNPNFGFEVNAWAPNNEKKLFNTGKQGEKAAFVQQLIHIGGQRKNQIQLAKSNAKVAVLDFDMLLRDLKYELRQTFFNIYFDTKSINEVDKQLLNIQKLVEAYAIQTQKGNVALKDLVRLQNLQLNLQKNRTDLVNELIENKRTFNLLISNEKEATIIPQPSNEELKNYDKEILDSPDQLVTKAFENRPDFKKADQLIESSNWNYKLQQSLALPDLTFGANYDQRGGAFNNQTNLTMAMPLPLWNKNKGNIKASKVIINQAEEQKKIIQFEIVNDVKTAYSRYLEQKNNYKITKSEIPNNLENVYNGVYTNFLKRNISMLEFTDFLESYNQSVISINEISKAYIKSCEEINYTTGSILF